MFITRFELHLYKPLLHNNIKHVVVDDLTQQTVLVAPNGFGKRGVKQRKVQRGRAHDGLHALKRGSDRRKALGPPLGGGERAVHLPVGDCERSPLHRMSLLVSGSESRGEKDESRYFSVTFVGGSEEIS